MVMVDGAEYEVLGVFAKAKGGFFGQNRLDREITIPFETARLRYPQLERIMITAKARAGLRQAAYEEVEGILRKVRRTPPGEENDFALSTPDQIVQQLDRMTRLAVLVSLAISALIGVVNGLIVSYLGISAFIATLATGSIITGAVLGVSNSKTIITGIPDAFMAIGQGAIFGVSNPILIMCAVGAALWLLLEHTQLGRHLYAIGGSAEASRLSGIAVKRYAPFALAVCAACAGLGGLMAAAVLGAGRPQGVGDGYLLNAFAAVFIGASSLRPGKFHILGTTIGVLLIGVINNGLSVMGVPTYWQYIVQGALLIAALFSAGALTMRRH